MPWRLCDFTKYFCQNQFSWLIIFTLLPLETAANQETRLKSRQHYADGIQFSQAKYWEEASKEFIKAIQVDPKYNLAYANLGVSLSQLGNKKRPLSLSTKQ